MARTTIAAPSAIDSVTAAEPKVTIRAIQHADYDPAYLDYTTGKPMLPRTFMVGGRAAVIGSLYEVDAFTAEGLAKRGLAEIVGEVAA